MLDAHCHLDLYPDPSQTAIDAENAGVFTVCVTNLPSAFDVAYPYTLRFRKVRLALGLHPLTANMHSQQELRRFEDLVTKTSFVGEVGLDFSRDGFPTRDKQLISFRFVLRCLERKPKFVTVHSRGAEATVLDMLEEQYPHPIVFHWYTGTHRNLNIAIERGHFFSINPSMVWSEKGRRTIVRIPRDRILTESDGPFINIGSRRIVPGDIRVVEEALAKIWGIDSSAVGSRVAQNFRQLIKPMKRTERLQDI
jgi:TatD DNase family protein